MFTIKNKKSDWITHSYLSTKAQRLGMKRAAEAHRVLAVQALSKEQKRERK